MAHGSGTRRFIATGRVTDAIGPDPVGYIAYDADGRMMASVFRRDRPPPNGGTWSAADKADLHESMLAYVASWTLDGDRLVHQVEAAWNPNWQTDLSRPLTVNGKTLVISGAPGIDPATGEEVVYCMEFRKVRRPE